MENKYKLWVARDKRGGLFLYKTKPIRDCDFGIWFAKLDCIGTISKNLSPDLDAKAKEYADSVTDKEEIKELIINAYKAGYNI